MLRDSPMTFCENNFGKADGDDADDEDDEAPLYSAVVRSLTKLFSCLRRGDFGYTKMFF